MGTATRPALGRAEVSLTIDNTAGKLPADMAEVTITRTLFRSGDSEYSINGAPCRLLDIQELLSDTGVGRQQHVIVSQGHLDAILEARPEDRRSVIEEAAGVLKYPPPPRAGRASSGGHRGAPRAPVRPGPRGQAADPAARAPGRRGPLLHRAGRRAAGRPPVRGRRRALRPRPPARRGDPAPASEQRADEARARCRVGRARRRLGADCRRTLRRARVRPDGRPRAGRGDGRAAPAGWRACSGSGSARSPGRSTRPPTPTSYPPSRPKVPVWSRSSRPPSSEAETLAPEHDGPRRRRDRGSRRARVPSGSLGGRQRAAGAPKRRSRWPAASSPRSSTPSSGTGAPSTSSSPRLAAAERRSSLLEGEDHELGERLAETEQSRHRLQAAVAETEAAHRRCRPPVGGRRGGAASGRAGARPVPGPGRRARAGVRRGAGGCRRRAVGRCRRGGRHPPGPGRGGPRLGRGLRGRRRRLAGSGGRVGKRIGPGRPVPPPPGRRHRCGAGAHRIGRRPPRPGSPRPEQPAGTESLRRPCACRAPEGGTYPGLDTVLDTLLPGSCCARTGLVRGDRSGALPAPIWWW